MNFIVVSPAILILNDEPRAHRAPGMGASRNGVTAVGSMGDEKML